VLEREERIDLLVDKTHSLAESSYSFRKGAQQLKNKMWWQNTRLIAAMAGGATVRKSTRMQAVGGAAASAQLLMCELLCCLLWCSLCCT